MSASSASSSSVSVKATIARAIVLVLGALPLRVSQWAGRALGSLYWLLPNRMRARSRANIALCYPDQSPAWRRKLLRASLIATGRTLAESAWFWRHDADRSLRWVRDVHGEEHLDRARAAGRGVIFATPHIGSWELVGAWLSTRLPLTVLYRPPRLAALDGLMRTGRKRLGLTPVPADNSGVRALHRALRAGESIGLLPDQKPQKDQGVEALFMGQPAATLTLLSRIAARSGATVLFIVMLRRNDATGFDLHIWPADAAITDDNPATAARQINRETERAIELAPEQYMWSYSRFRRRKNKRKPRSQTTG